MPTSPDWYPAPAGSRITPLVVRDGPGPRIEEAVTAAPMGRLTYGVQFAQGDRNPGYDLEPEIVAALLADDGGPLRDGQRIAADRLNAAAQRAFG